MPGVDRGEYPARGICQTQPPLLPPAAKQVKVINLGLHPLQPTVPSSTGMLTGGGSSTKQGSGDIFSQSLSTELSPELELIPVWHKRCRALG